MSSAWRKHYYTLTYVLRPAWWFVGLLLVGAVVYILMS